MLPKVVDAPCSEIIQSGREISTSAVDHLELRDSLHLFIVLVELATFGSGDKLIDLQSAKGHTMVLTRSAMLFPMPLIFMA